MNTNKRTDSVSHPTPSKQGGAKLKCETESVSHPCETDSETGVQMGLFQFRTRETDVRNCETTPPQSQFRTSLPPFKGGESAKLDSQGPRNDLKPPSLDEAVDALADARVMLNRDIRRLYRRRDDTVFANRVEHTLVRYAAATYLPAIDQVRAFPREDVTARRDALSARLERGWSVPGERADDLFDELLPEYEALCDALMPDCLSPLLERVERARA